MKKLETQPAAFSQASRMIQDRAIGNRLGGIVAATVEPGGTYFVHLTEDGPILIISRRSDTGWTTAIEGRQLAVGVSGNSHQAVLIEGEARFFEMFPEHQCTSECGWRLRES